MCSSENDQNLFILSRKIHKSSANDYNSTRSMPLSPFQPHTQRENLLLEDSTSPSLKRKRAPSPPLVSSILRQTPTTGLSDIGALLANSTPPTRAIGVTARNYSAAGAASISLSSTSISDQDGSRAKIRAAAIGQHAPGEGPHDVPPIAFLREQSSSVSPVLSARAISPRMGGGGATDATRSGADSMFVARASHVSLPLITDAPLRIGSSDAQGPPTLPTTSFARSFPFSAAPSLSQSGAKSSAARTRAETGASAHEPAPRYKYTYDSLIRKPVASRAQGGHHRNTPYEQAGQRELEVACETAEAPVGVLSGPPTLGPEGIAALAQALREQNKGRDQQTQPEIRYQSRPNTAPTAAYLVLLEETFGAGSVLRGEGTKPAAPSRRRKAGPRAKESSSSTGTGSSVAETDVDMDEVESVDIGGSRAQEWIAEIEVLVKGKRQLMREDFKSLAGTLRDIANMDAAEGRALGDDAPRLRKSLWQLAQLEDIPFRDEHKLRAWARKLLKHWPET
ncbi:hypothetical protein FB451DRAFT_34079 [Mycena latifolia]|nr:hypothetical protein FB451DRAFT_34079 [Mycena latifolia]